MSCCGSKRMALVHGHAAETTPPPTASPGSLGLRIHDRPARGDVPMRYLGVGLFTTRGNHTGRVYLCSGSGAQLSVDPRDAEMLMRTRLFVRT